MKHVSIDDIFHIKSVSAPKVIKEENSATYYVTHLDEKENKYVTHLHETNAYGLKQLTFDNERVSQVAHSNDGNLTLFVAKGDNDKPQIFLLRRTGAEREQLTNERDGDSNPLYSIDGTSVIYHVYVKRKDKEDDKSDYKKQPVHITNMKYKSDGLPVPFGYKEESHQVVKKIDVLSRECETVLSGSAYY